LIALNLAGIAASPRIPAFLGVTFRSVTAKSTTGETEPAHLAAKRRLRITTQP
jgi:hypothetical protein